MCAHCASRKGCILVNSVIEHLRVSLMEIDSSCPKRFDDGEAITSLSNDKEDLERRPEKKYHEEDDDKLNNLPKDLDEVGDDVDDKGKDDGKEETDVGDTESDRI